MVAYSMVSASLSDVLSASFPVVGPPGEGLGVAPGVGWKEVISTVLRVPAQRWRTRCTKRRWRPVARPDSPATWPPNGRHCPPTRAANRSRPIPAAAVVAAAPARSGWGLGLGLGLR